MPDENNIEPIDNGPLAENTPSGKRTPTVPTSRRFVKTGISGLDEMLGGGIPARHSVLVAGGPGCGKTSVCFEYLLRGALAGEKGLYISLEETSDSILENAKAAFSDLTVQIDQMVSEGMILIEKPEKFDIMGVGDIVSAHILNDQVSRVVIDSTTMLALTIKDEAEYRTTMYEFLQLLGGMECTTVLVYERTSPRKEDIHFTIEQFVTDGMINLYNTERGESRVRSLEIMKMRGAKHSQDIVPFKILPSGVKIFKGEKVY